MLSPLKTVSVPRYRFLPEELPALDPHGLLLAAMDAWRKAYVPYSFYRVGAAVRTADGSVFTGCNVECADYLGTHAEESALAAMTMAGRRDPVIIAVVGALDTEEPAFSNAPPCGSCRQKLMEFAQFTGMDIRIIVTDASGPLYVLLSDLLPDAFGPSKIGVDQGRRR